jgi:transcriptional regulator with XRE-family HTH domain
MTIGDNILLLRKKKGLSQAALGKLIGTSGDIMGRYERGDMAPSVDVVIRIADALGVSVDYLVGKTDFELDTATLRRIEEVSKLPEEDQKQVFLLLDALLRDFRARRAYSF